MHIKQKELEILEILYPKLKRIAKLKDKISFDNNSGFLNIEKVETEIKIICEEALKYENQLFEIIDKMRMGVMEKFLVTLPKDILAREKVYLKYGNIHYSFSGFLDTTYIFEIRTFNKFIKNVDRLFDKDLFLQCLEEEKSGKYVRKPIKELFHHDTPSHWLSYSHRFTFQTQKYREMFNKMLLEFQEEKKTSQSYSSIHDEYVESWEDDRYDDSYGAWLRKGGPYKETEDYDGAFDPHDGGDFF
ncbi:MAG: hypothetical protein GX638_17710 [Crenarchaeota archaeon]|nr:hypothetical protein [Thermoproteota archaeon]